MLHVHALKVLTESLSTLCFVETPQDPHKAPAAFQNMLFPPEHTDVSPANMPIPTSHACESKCVLFESASLPVRFSVNSAGSKPGRHSHGYYPSPQIMSDMPPKVSKVLCYDPKSIMAKPQTARILCLVNRPLNSSMLLKQPASATCNPMLHTSTVLSTPLSVLELRP